MTIMRVSGAGVARAGSSEAEAESLKAFVTAFKRQTQQRYIDKAAEFGIKALHDAMAHAGGDPFRIGILVATARGPVSTREQYLRTYAQRGGKSVSATVFSNCGYNIVGSMLARSSGVRGPVLTFDAGGNWLEHLLDTARRLFAAGRVDRLFVGRAEADGAAMIGLEAATAGITGAGDNRGASITLARPADQPQAGYRLYAGARDLGALLPPGAEPPADCDGAFQRLAEMHGQVGQADGALQPVTAAPEMERLR